MSLLKPALAALLSLAGLGGCAPNYVALDVPKADTPLGPRPRTDTITHRIRCELARLVDPNVNPYTANEYTQYLVDVQLTLDVTDDGSLAPTFAYTNGLFSLGGGAKLDYSRDSSFTADLLYSLGAIARETAIERAGNNGVLPADSDYACPAVWQTNLDGELGLTTAGLMGLRTNDVNTGDSLGKTAAFGGQIQFIVTKNLNGVGPTWTLKSFKGPGGLAGISEVNTDKIVFAFAMQNPIILFAAQPVAHKKGAVGETPVMAGGRKTGKQKAAKPLFPAAPAINPDAVVSARNYIESINISQLGTTLSKIRVNTQ